MVKKIVIAVVLAGGLIYAIGLADEKINRGGDGDNPQEIILPTPSSNFTNPTMEDLSGTSLLFYSEPKENNPSIYQGRVHGTVSNISVGRILTITRHNKTMQFYIDEKAPISKTTKIISEGVSVGRRATFEEIAVGDNISMGFVSKPDKPLSFKDVLIDLKIQPLD